MIQKYVVGFVKKWRCEIEGEGVREITYSSEGVNKRHNLDEVIEEDTIEFEGRVVSVSLGRKTSVQIHFSFQTLLLIANKAGLEGEKRGRERLGLKYNCSNLKRKKI